MRILIGSIVNFKLSDGTRQEIKCLLMMVSRWSAFLFLREKHGQPLRTCLKRRHTLIMSSMIALSWELERLCKAGVLPCLLGKRRAPFYVGIWVQTMHRRVIRYYLPFSLPCCFFIIYVLVQDIHYSRPTVDVMLPSLFMHSHFTHHITQMSPLTTSCNISWACAHCEPKAWNSHNENSPCHFSTPFPRSYKV